MKKEFNIGDLVRKVTPKLPEFQNMFGVVLDIKITEAGFIYRVHYGEDYGLFWQAPVQIKPFLLDR